MSLSILLQDMYQYVLSKDVVPPFSLYPRTLLILSNESVVLYGDVLFVVELETPSWDQNILDALSHKAVSVMVDCATSL